MSSIKDEDLIYDITNYRQIIISMGVSIVLFLVTVYAIKQCMNSIVEEQRTYEKFSIEENEWRKRTQHNLNRPKDKKFNV